MRDRCAFCLEGPAEIVSWRHILACRPCLEKDGARGRRAIARHDLGTAPEAYTPDVLKRLADGPIMDGNALYLPAGRLSEAEYRARQSEIVLESAK